TQTDISCRLPLLVLFGTGAMWLVLSSVLGLIASIKFHSPGFLADQPWLTYGRVLPASRSLLVFGFAIPSALGVMLWMFTRLGRTPLVSGWLAIIGACGWHFGVAMGLFGILLGDSSGFEGLEIAGYAAPVLVVSYLLVGICAASTFHARTE